MAAKSDDEIQPENLLHFVETDEFMNRWASLGLDAEKDLWDLQDAIMRSPMSGRVVPGTGSLRKLRFGLGSQRVGKRGGLRVCYVHFPEHGIVLLVTAYGKKQKDDLTPTEKKEIRNSIHLTKALLDRRKQERSAPNG